MRPTPSMQAQESPAQSPVGSPTDRDLTGFRDGQSEPGAEIVLTRGVMISASHAFPQ